MEAVSTSETLVYFYETTWCNIPEGCELDINFYHKGIGDLISEIKVGWPSTAGVNGLAVW
jgi:hypothetical protein